MGNGTQYKDKVNIERLDGWVVCCCSSSRCQFLIYTTFPLHMAVFRLVEKYGLVPRFVLEQPSLPDTNPDDDFDILESALNDVDLDKVCKCPQ